MSNFKTKAQDFLAHKNIAVVGVSRGEQATGNYIYRKLRDEGYTVFPVNPNADEVEGVPCYPDLKTIPVALDGVMVVARPEVAEQIAHECAEVGAPRLWMHENAMFGSGASSVSNEAVAFCHENDITVIDGGCPMMFLDFGHKCMRVVLGMMRKLPN